MGTAINLISREGRGKTVIGKKVADILLARRAFCEFFRMTVCLDKITKWSCFVSLYHGLRVALADVDAL